MQNYKITPDDIDENGYLKKHFPEEVQGSFNCYYMPLKSLKGVPKKIGENFNCSYTSIKSLIDGPQWVGRDYYCAATPITSLEGAPQYVGGNFYCFETKITSLEGIGRKFLKQINGYIKLDDCHIQSHMLGLLLVKNLKGIDFDTNEFSINFYKHKRIEEIFNRHLQGDRDVIECQYELIQSDFKDYAKL